MQKKSLNRNESQMIITVATTEVKLDFFTYISILKFLTPLETAEWMELALACFLQNENQHLKILNYGAESEKR